MPTSLPPAEQEALFQAVIRKIPVIKDPGHLEELAVLAVALMLRRPVDRGLAQKLTQCIHGIFAGGDGNAPPEEIQPRMRRIARDCVEVLQAAKEHRLPRDIVYPPEARRRPRAAHHAISGRGYTATTGRGVLAAVVVMVVLGGLSLWYGARHQGGSNFADGNAFAAQVIAAGEAEPEAASDRPPGGVLITRRVVEGRTVVVAEGVAPRICAAAGGILVRKGVLTVNGVTPNRISSAIITELCNSEDGDANIMWTPK